MFGIFKSRLMWDGAGKGTLLQWYHAKGGAPKRDVFVGLATHLTIVYRIPLLYPPVN